MMRTAKDALKWGAITASVGISAAGIDEILSDGRFTAHAWERGIERLDELFLPTSLSAWEEDQPQHQETLPPTESLATSDFFSCPRPHTEKIAANPFESTALHRSLIDTVQELVGMNGERIPFNLQARESELAKGRLPGVGDVAWFESFRALELSGSCAQRKAEIRLRDELLKLKDDSGQPLIPHRQLSVKFLVELDDHQASVRSFDIGVIGDKEVWRTYRFELGAADQRHFELEPRGELRHFTFNEQAGNHFVRADLTRIVESAACFYANASEVEKEKVPKEVKELVTWMLSTSHGWDVKQVDSCFARATDGHLERVQMKVKFAFGPSNYVMDYRFVPLDLRSTRFRLSE